MTKELLRHRAIGDSRKGGSEMSLLVSNGVINSRGSEKAWPPLRTGHLRERLATVMFRGLAWSAPVLAGITPIRTAVMRWYEDMMCAGYQNSVRTNPSRAAIEADRLAIGIAILHSIERALAEKRLGATTLRRMFNTLVYNVLIRQGERGAKERFRAVYGCHPPDFLVISPGKACNLRCKGCYADSGPAPEKLDWATFERVMREAHDLWGARFFVFSGGEPLAYRDNGRGVLDMAEKYLDSFFLMYTNGTLITDEVARRLGALGNFTPAISVEGLEERTDERRGPGVFKRVIAAMERLRREGVLFGLSLTATRENAEELFADEVIDFYFEKMGALYAWIFHYMPIGRAFTLELMPTPEQRVWMWKRMWQLVRERHLVIADFWNSGTASSGCVSAGRPGGYLYIDWNGAVSPCVFVPYSPINIHDAYAQGKTLNDVWSEPFFARIRAWQQAYGFKEYGIERDLSDQKQPGNWLMPCPIRDHHAEFYRLLMECEPEPTDENAAAALMDPSYHEGLAKFDRELAALMDPIWESLYVSPNTSQENS